MLSVNRLTFLSCVIISSARRLDTSSVIHRVGRNVDSRSSQEKHERPAFRRGAGNRPHFAAYANAVGRAGPDAYANAGKTRPGKKDNVAKAEDAAKKSFKGIAILGLDAEDHHLAKIMEDLYKYTGILSKCSAIGDKAILMTKMGVDYEREAFLKKKGRFAESMSEAWSSALESKSRLVLIVKTEEDSGNQELKVKVGYKLSPAETKQYQLPTEAGVSIIDVVDVDNALVTRDLPSLLPGHKPSRRSSDYNVQSLIQETNFTSVSKQAESAVKSLFWIILHEVIVHDWLKLSHHYSASKGAAGYNYNNDDALNMLSSWRMALGVPDRLGHPSIFDRQDAICGYLWLDPLRTHLNDAGGAPDSSRINWWLNQTDPTEFAALAPSFGQAKKFAKRLQRKRLYLRFREEMSRLNKLGAPFLHKYKNHDFFKKKLYSGTLIWAFFDDKDINKPPADTRIRMDPVWLHRRLKPLKAYLNDDPQAVSEVIQPDPTETSSDTEQLVAKELTPSTDEKSNGNGDTPDVEEFVDI